MAVKALAPIGRGQPAIFLHKTGGEVRGSLTVVGSVRFEHARRRFAKLVGWEYERVLDGDVVEYLARGETSTRAYLASRPAM